MKRPLILGAGGQLGRALCREFHALPELLTPSRREADLETPTELRRYLQSSGADVVVLAAAQSDVDACEKDPARAARIHESGVLEVARYCESESALLVLVSTDFVFSGASETAYREDDPTEPVNVYGQTKRRGEQLAQQACARTVVLRTSWLFDGQGPNWLTRLLERIASGALLAARDQHGSPTYAPELARVIHSVVSRHDRDGKDAPVGVFHAAGAQPVSRLTASLAVLRQLGLETQITERSYRDFETYATRPASTVLDCSKLFQVFGERLAPFDAALPELEQAMRRHIALFGLRH